MLVYDNCPNCFAPIGNGTVCPDCGSDYTKYKKYSGTLPIFSLLNNRYLVGRVLGKGGFGITYVAKDIATNRLCAIKEYMPAEYSSRADGTLDIVPFSDEKSRFVFLHGKEKFVDEAKTLIKLKDNPIVVDILDYFTQNNTAYLVMEFLDGLDLRQMAKNAGGKLDSKFALQVFVTIASSLMEIHKKNILHRDLSPENIIFTKDGKIKLIDFGAARNFVSTQNKGMSILLKPGFAPPEQYNAKGQQGPWSDEYALCATFYTLVSGRPLIDALYRYRGESQPSLAALGCPVSKKTSDVIERGMELDIKRRYKDFKALLDDIDIITSTNTAQKNPTTSSADVPQKQGYVKQIATAQPVSGQASQKQEKSAPYIAAIVGNTLCNKVYVNTSDLFKIGRSSQSCQYVISGDTNISRIHCYLRFDGQKLYLCDSSSNGTFFENGVRLIKNKEYVIASGTKFYVATRNHMLIINV